MSQQQHHGFCTKLSTGFVLALLFTYQKLATTSFTLLNCVPVGNRTVLFVQGTIECYQTWQMAVAIYAATCITPFPGTGQRIASALALTLSPRQRLALTTWTGSTTQGLTQDQQFLEQLSGWED